MSRAAILPYPGDPFLFNFWLHFFDNCWGQEIDKLYVYLNSPAEKGVIDYIRNLCSARPKISFIYNPERTDHGICIDRTLDIVAEDLVMLIEDDGFIFKPGYVTVAFGFIERDMYDVVGSKRGSCDPEILERAKEIWGLNYEGLGDQGCNFWPNFFFCKTDLLRKTDRNFRAKAWYKGEVIPALDDYVVQKDVIYGDTFVNTSLQIRAMKPKLRIHTENQYHCNTYDLEDAQENRNIFDKFCPWLHVGSLSSGITGILRDDENRALDRRLIDEPKGQTQLPIEWCQTEPEKREWERRVAWFEMFIDYFENENKGTPHITPGILNYGVMYRKAVTRVKFQYSLSPTRINKSKLIYRKLLGL